MEILKQLPIRNVDIHAYNQELIEARVQHELLSQTIKDPQAFSSVLDIGSSSGAFLHYMFERGFKRLIGFEAHRGLSRVKDHPIAIEIYEQKYQYEKIKYERFDLITVHESKELTENPRYFLESLKVLLKPTGVLMLALRMNKKEVKQLLEDAGFEVLAQDFYADSLTVKQWLLVSKMPAWLRDTILDFVILFRLENLQIKLRRGSLATTARRR